MVVENNLAACPSESANTVAVEPSGAKPPAAESSKQIQEDRTLKVEKAMKQFVIWVDKETYLPLKTTMLTQSDEVIDESETTRKEYDIAVPDSVFTYTPPAGATVSEAGAKGWQVGAARSSNASPAPAHLQGGPTTDHAGSRHPPGSVRPVTRWRTRLA